MTRTTLMAATAMALVAAVIAYVLPGRRPLVLDHELEVEEGELGAAGLARHDLGAACSRPLRPTV